MMVFDLWAVVHCRYSSTFHALPLDGWKHVCPLQHGAWQVPSDLTKMVLRALPGADWARQGVLWGSGRLCTGLPRWCVGLFPEPLGLFHASVKLSQALPWAPRDGAWGLAGVTQALCEALPSPALASQLQQGALQALCQAPKVLLRALPGPAGDSEALHWAALNSHRILAGRA